MKVDSSSQKSMKYPDVEDLSGLYKWKKIEVDQLGTCPQGFREIFEGNLDGFLIKNVMSQKELQTFSKNFTSWHTKVKTPMPFGEFYGKKVNRSDGNFQKLELGDYFSLSGVFREDLRNVFGFDIEKRIMQTIHAVAEGVEVYVPKNDEGLTFIPSSVRVCKPYKGAIGSHVGNDFNYKMPEIQLLDSMAKLEGQLSYFLLLEQPESGGELVLFDLLWPESPESISNQEQLGNEERDEVLDNLQKMHIAPQAGDMILFAGGRIWHRVKDIGGSVDRITIGGFATFSRNEEKIIIWG
ncbi:MAG: hypothetical protein COB85_04565 [Bacteroidetes bacterium]|nr:MAG: hypothetical protein COB85_04565 [Bacteroidota bacterium]